MKRYNTPHRSRVVKTRLTDEEYADFTARLAPYSMSQSEFIRQAITRATIRPIVTVSPVNDELLAAVGKLTAEYGRIGGNLNQIARTLNEWHSPYPAMAKELKDAAADLAALKYIELFIGQSSTEGERKRRARMKISEQKRLSGQVSEAKADICPPEIEIKKEIDTSKKIKAVKKAKGLSGKPVTSKPVYGYIMDDDENFIIDEEAAPVVKQIYQLCLAGNGPTKIARMLTEQQIPTPGTLEYQRTGSTRRYHPGYECKWATNTVVHLLENREYTGCLVNFKTEKPSYKMKHSVDNPIEKQAIFENHHEPIIDLQTWERVQELRKQRKRPNRYDDVGLFSGLLFCADCGHVMYQQRYQTDKRKQDCYICGSYKKRTADCTAHFIRTDLLTAGVLDNLRKVTAYAQKHEARFVKLLIQQNEMGGKRKLAAATKQLEQAQSRIAELSRYIKRLYEDNVNGKINDERFMEMSADYEAEQRELKEKAAALQGELDKAQEATVNAEKFMNVVRKYLSIEELTHTLLREMVEKIVVYECEYDENEVRHQRIDIYYSFVGKIDLPEE